MKADSERRAVRLLLASLGGVTLAGAGAHLLSAVRVAHYAAGPALGSHSVDLLREIRADALYGTLLACLGLGVGMWASRAFRRRSSDRLRREEADAARLAGQSDILRTAIDGLPDCVAVLDKNGIVLAANRTWAQYPADRGFCNIAE